MVPWAHPNPRPKRHLDRFGGFCRGHDRDRPTDDRPRYSVCNSRPHLRTYVVMQCGLKNTEYTTRQSDVVCAAGFRSLYSIFTALQHLRLGSNPLHCGCEAVWLMELHERNSDVFKGASQPSCASPVRLRGQHFDELSLSDFRCQVQTPPSSRYSSRRLGVVASVVRRMNEVTLRRARLVLAWVTVFGRVYHHGM